jgi:hypothetical protein
MLWLHVVLPVYWNVFERVEHPRSTFSSNNTLCSDTNSRAQLAVLIVRLSRSYGGAYDYIPR